MRQVWWKKFIPPLPPPLLKTSTAHLLERTMLPVMVTIIVATVTKYWEHIMGNVKHSIKIMLEFYHKSWLHPELLHVTADSSVQLTALGWSSSCWLLHLQLELASPNTPLVVTLLYCTCTLLLPVWVTAVVKSGNTRRDWPDQSLSPTHKYTQTHRHTHKHTQTHTHTDTWIHTDTHMRTHTNTQTHTHTHVHTQHTHRQARTHTGTQNLQEIMMACWWKLDKFNRNLFDLPKR